MDNQTSRCQKPDNQWGLMKVIKPFLRDVYLAWTVKTYKGDNVPKVDLHVHYVPQAYKDALIAHFGQELPDGFPTPKWNPETHLEVMNRLGITVALLSISSPHINFGDNHAAQVLARKANEEGAEVVRKYPKRFGLLASLPLPDVKASIEEIRYAMDILQADGFTLPTNTRGIYLGDPQLDPVLAELNRRKAIIVLHPNEPSAVPENVLENFPIPFMEFFFDTTRAVANMMINGTLRQFPDVKIVVPHAGACIPVLADRWHGASQIMPLGKGKVDVYADLKRLYYDVAGACLPSQLAALLHLAAEDHLVYGSDYPYTPEFGCVFLTNALDKTELITKRQRQAIYCDNALKLFPRIKGV